MQCLAAGPTLLPLLLILGSVHKEKKNTKNSGLPKFALLVARTLL